MGSSVSAIDIVKQIYQKANSVSMTVTKKDAIESWMARAVRSPQILQKSSINKFAVQKGPTETSTGRVNVEFSDGTMQTYDSVILATGYHSFFPFIDRNFFEGSTAISEERSNKTRVKNLYLHTFHMDDPTLSVMGFILPSVLFHLMETQAIAISGVYARMKLHQKPEELRCTDLNARKANVTESLLPELEEQKKWESDRELTTGTKFESYRCEHVQEELGQHLVSLGPSDRQSPLEIDCDAPTEYLEGLTKLESLFKRSLGS